ncbi:DUF6443 domain-containing protein [Chryseobacterium sp. DT-3]|uniref:DUF6443 domain-containing protein n=1 Tax=Chryseobacterium sp. DT-3 TaxID=3396164 RepID=UPI003F1B6756
MKKLILLINILIVTTFHSQNLTASENYIYSRTYLEAVTSEQASAAQTQNVKYLDGIGRPKQSVAIKASPSGKDIIVPFLYDTDGKLTKSYLPLPLDSQDGAFITNNIENTASTYYGVSNPFFEVKVEKAPFARIEKSASPGIDWQMNGNHIQRKEYLLNSANTVKRFKAVTVWNPSTKINNVSIIVVADDDYTSNGYYDTNTLFKIVTKDEDNNEIHNYSNAANKTILNRKLNIKSDGSVENFDTYYVYDDFGNLAFIIPPKAAISTLTSTVLDQLCYQYKYDKYNRLVEKKLPGKDWEYMIYDGQNRLVASQDGNLRAKNQWAYMKYDRFGRVVVSGINMGSTRANEQAIVDQKGLNNVNRIDYVFYNRQGMDVYYDNPDTTYPDSSTWVTLLSVNYYDTYPNGSPIQPSQILNQPILLDNPTSFTSNGYASVRSTKALPTVSYIKNVENDNWSSAVIWYDTLGRPIGTYGKNHLGGFTRTESEVDFSGKTKEIYTYHSKNSSATEVTIKDRFVYTSQSYLSKHYQQINSNTEELLSEYTYNDVGQVINKKVGNNLQSIDYTYNIRGWLTKVNDPTNLVGKLFGYELKYTNTLYPGYASPKYNGNIAQVDWATGNDGILRRYSYQYDSLNRLADASYSETTSTVPINEFYSESVVYDLNGNITNLYRNSKGLNGTAEQIDRLEYTYLGNRLAYVKDASHNISGYPVGGNSISYDANGNMTNHVDKGYIGITYNFLNLPAKVTNNNKSLNTNYIYTADGVKVQMSYGAVVTDYVGNFQYTTSSGTTTSSVVSNEEGYFDFVNNRYVYNYKDHLGNIRISYTKGADGKPVILEENNYYAFGLKHAGYNVGDATNNKFKYLYNGKELQTNGNLDYGWRQYMPDLGRWNGVDQLAEKFHFSSPYAYVINNPILYIDPDGRLSEDFMSAMWKSSPAGQNTQWENMGDYFQNGGSIAINFNGTYVSPNTSSPGSNGNNLGGSYGDISGSLYNFIGIGDVFIPTIYKELPALHFIGDKSKWAEQFKNHMNMFMDGVMEFADNAWEGKLSRNHYIDEIVNNKYYDITSLGLDQAVAKTTAYVTKALQNNSSVNFTVLDNYAKPAFRTELSGNMVKTSKVATAAKGLKIVGNALAVVGVGVGIYQVSTGQITKTEFVVDTIMTGVGVFGGPVGALVSLAYFGGKTLYELQTGEELFGKP